MDYLPIVILWIAFSISGSILLYAGFRTKKQLDLTGEYLEALDDFINERLASLEKQLNKSSLPEDDDSEDDWEDDSITEEDDDEYDYVVEDQYEGELEDDNDDDYRLLSQEPLGTLCIDHENDLVWSTDGKTTKSISRLGRPITFSLGPDAIHVVRKATPEDIKHYLDLVIERYGKIA